MKQDLMEEINRLANQEKFNEIIAIVKDIPENERNLEWVGCYVRALNNTDELDMAVEVSLKYRHLGEHDPLWYYRLGYAYLYLNRNAEAEAALLCAKELANGNVEVCEWIDELMDVMKEHENYELHKAESEKLRRESFVAHDPNFDYFSDVDFTNFWQESDYALKKYVGDVTSDEMFIEAEQTLGYKLPEAYKVLMKQQNGGIPTKSCFQIPFTKYNEPSEVWINGIMGVDSRKTHSLIGELGSQFMVEEWGYPRLGIAICDCPSAGHNMIFLDYRECGVNGEPSVVHINQESDYEITYLAGDFESFICGLSQPEEEADEIDLESAYTAIIKHETSLSVCFYLEHSKPFSIGEKMEKINENAYMNGYNWSAFFNYYLTKYMGDLLIGMESDPEAGLYVAYYDLNPENEEKALKYVEVMKYLVENEEEIYRIIKEEGNLIEWD